MPKLARFLDTVYNAGAGQLVVPHNAYFLILPL